MLWFKRKRKAKNKERVLLDALDTVASNLDIPVSKQKRHNIPTDHGNYMALKTICAKRNWTITKGHNILLRDILSQVYEKEKESMLQEIARSKNTNPQ